METGEGFMSVMDHGVEVSIEHLPKIPCSKFTIIGNSRMRNKKPVRKKEQMWKVPKGSRRHHTADQEKKSVQDLKQPLKVTAKSLEPKFGNQEENNRLDKNGIYGDAFQRTLDLTHPGSRGGPAQRKLEPKPEKKIIDAFYRDKSSLFLHQFGKKNADRRSGRHDLSLPSLAKGRLGTDKPTQSCQGTARHYCDVVGQRYCTACLRMHRLDKLAYRSTEGGKEPRPNPKSSFGTFLPNIRTKPDGDWTTGAPSSKHGAARTKSSPLFSQKQSSYGPRTWERVGPPYKTHEDRKRRKVTDKSTVMVKRMPYTLDITTDTDSRHLNS
ncbi:uncharacterized protein LOC119741053 [Patiria miniata]|uniref:Uncharacterized protein n=1 Tax=Patiria miniata TaxID=46514 RepID=A0A914B8Y0_PATMI|nr:uncharacterized protein LOC119741053 [Patiria miniata]